MFCEQIFAAKIVTFLQLCSLEMEELVDAFKHPTQTRDDGIALDGVLYKCIRADKFSIYAKKVIC